LSPFSGLFVTFFFWGGVCAPPPSWLAGVVGFQYYFPVRCFVVVVLFCFRFFFRQSRGNHPAAPPPADVLAFSHPRVTLQKIWPLFGFGGIADPPKACSFQYGRTAPSVPPDAPMKGAAWVFRCGVDKGGRYGRTQSLCCAKYGKTGDGPSRPPKCPPGIARRAARESADRATPSSAIFFFHWQWALCPLGLEGGPSLPRPPPPYKAQPCEL